MPSGLPVDIVQFGEDGEQVWPRFSIESKRRVQSKQEKYTHIVQAIIICSNILPKTSSSSISALMISGKSKASKKDWGSIHSRLLGWRRGLEGVQVMKGLVSKGADYILLLVHARDLWHRVRHDWSYRYTSAERFHILLGIGSVNAFALRVKSE
jgi:hypothetical protein